MNNKFEYINIYIKTIFKLMFKEEESNILVAIRVRPLNVKETMNDELDVIRVEDNLIVVFQTIIDYIRSS